MKKAYCLFLVIIIPAFAFSQEQGFSFGNFSFFLSPKILDDGSILDAGLALMYSDNWVGELRFRNTSVSKNEEIENVADSLNAINENDFEVFLLPAAYYICRTPATRL